MMKFSTAVLIINMCLLVAFSPTLFAAEDDQPIVVKVIRSKGKNSLIRVSNRYKGSLPSGVYRLVKGKEEPTDKAEKEPRNHSLSGSINTGLFKSTTKTSSTETTADQKNLDVNLTYGWNKEKFEFGPFASYSFTTTGSVDQSTMVLGLFADWNFRPNNEDHEWIPGLRLQAGYGQEDNSSLSKAYNVTEAQLGVFLKAFALNPSLALVPEIAYKMKIGKPEGSTVTTSGPLARLGVVGYF